MNIQQKRDRIGGRIKDLRLKMGLSQDILSKRANLSFQTISKIESEATPNPTIDTVKKIAIVLGVSLDDLMR